MKIYEKVYSSTAPQQIEITENNVFIANNIQQYTKQLDGYTRTGYEYDLTEYTKDEYLIQQNATIATLQEELAAAKILLGVD